MEFRGTQKLTLSITQIMCGKMKSAVHVDQMMVRILILLESSSTEDLE